MTTAHQRQTDIARIRMLPAQLARLVDGMTDAQLDFSRGPGDWTARQVVHHLADSHINAYVRSKLIATEDRPPLKGYHQEVWAEMTDAKALPLAVSFAILEGIHSRWVTFFENLPDDAWARVGIHSEDGEMSLAYILEHYAWHGDNHLAQIQTLRNAQGS